MTAFFIYAVPTHQARKHSIDAEVSPVVTITPIRRHHSMSVSLSRCCDIVDTSAVQFAGQYDISAPHRNCKTFRVPTLMSTRTIHIADEGG